MTVRKYPIARPTEAAAICATASHPGPTAPSVVLIERAAVAYSCRDRFGFRHLVHLLNRAVGEVGER